MTTRGWPRFAVWDPYAYREFARRPGTFTGGLIQGWTPLYFSEFRGITENGALREGLYPLTPPEPGEAGEAAPVEAMVDAATELLAELDDDGRCRRPSASGPRCTGR
jgi:hypothetical protein